MAARAWMLMCEERDQRTPLPYRGDARRRLHRSSDRRRHRHGTADAAYLVAFAAKGLTSGDVSIEVTNVNDPANKVDRPN